MAVYPHSGPGLPVVRIEIYPLYFLAYPFCHAHPLDIPTTPAKSRRPRWWILDPHENMHVIFTLTSIHPTHWLPVLSHRKVQLVANNRDIFLHNSCEKEPTPQPATFFWSQWIAPCTCIRELWHTCIWRVLVYVTMLCSCFSLQSHD